MNTILRFRLNQKLQTFLSVALLCMAAGIPQSHAEFDPVNDDTDIFLANPNVESQRPNVLIYVDNTANWSQPFANEKAALKSVVDNVSDQFNVGLMMFPETGGNNDSVDGGYVRYGVRQMTEDNSSVLSSIVNNFDTQGDRGNNATTALGMVEVYRYLSGGTSRASHGKEKTDYANNTDEPGGHPATNAGIGEHPLPASPTSSSNYTSPIVHECQSNFLIYLSNGSANENQSALAEAESELASVGYDTSSTISLNPSGQQGNWMDEWSKFMANADINPDLDGVQNLTTYTVEVDRSSTGQGPDMTALMKSTASNGKGEYFSVSSGNNGQAIVNALNTIFQEVQAVNSVFASTTLPVSVNVRGTNLNQVYIGVFRPDARKSPRWLGNLKLYELGFDDATNTLFLQDAAGSEAENPETGFINSNAVSFWTENSNFWSFRSAEENGAGGASDLPDGDLVEKGGTAQQQRIEFATDQSGRNLYTCTGTCVNGSSLSATPFDLSNDDINETTLQLDTRAVSSLTGFETQDVESLSDTKEVEGIAMVDQGRFLNSLSVVTISQDVDDLTTNRTHAITNLDDGRIDQNIDSLTHPTIGPATEQRTATAVVNGGHGLSTGNTVTISGTTEDGYNGTFTITKEDDQTFTYNGGKAVQNAAPEATGTPIVTSTSTVITATVPSHGFSGGASVTIAGVSPTSYNDTYTVNRIDDDTFTFTVSASLQPIEDFSGATASGATKTARATLPGHGYTDGSSVTINGADQAEFNGTKTITVTGTDTFTYPVSSALGDATGTIKAIQGSSVVTATTSSPHNINAGDIVTIAGAVQKDYNGVFTADTVPDTSTFTYDAGQPLPATGLDPDAAVFYCDGGGGPCTLALAVVNNHGLDTLGAGTVVIEGARDDLNDPSTSYNGNSITINTPTPTKDSFTYNSQDGNSPGPAATGDITMRVSAPTAFVNVPGHGYSDTDNITIKGADQSEYNGEFSITVLDADNFAYTHNGSGFSTIGEATGTISANIKTTTARARAVNHGFVTGNIVTMSGASPADFNGDFTVTKIDDNNFTYDLTENGGSEQGDAGGTIVASTGTASGAEADNIVEWVRGTDNFEDEDADGVSTDVRASVHGDVLHSRPAVVNYNRHGNEDDVYVFYGSNDGIFRAVKGGFSQSDIGEPEPGNEAWGFIPEEFFPDLQRLRNNEPTISSANKKPYFVDGTITVLAEDNNNDGKLDINNDDDANPDKVHLFVSMRRGGRFMYALDVSDPQDPQLLWRKSFADSGFAELGYTWSAPNVTTLNANGGEPVLIFGAGYDQSVEDVPPDSITSMDASPHTTVTAGAADYPRGMGRGIFVLDAATGDIIWQAGPSGSDPGTGHHFETVPGMDFAIPSDVTVISDRSGSIDNRAYVGDTGGNVWRVDIGDSDVANWEVTKLAAIGDHGSLPEGDRKFLFPPDVVHSDDGYDAVLIGSGDREHPFDETVVNRFYMFKDCSIGTSVQACYKDGASSPPLAEADLFDATSNCIQDETSCSGTGDETDSTTAANALTEADGWFITLGEGEKTVGTAVTLNNVTFFNTNQPSTVVSSSDCSSDLGLARQYEVQFDDATALLDQNIDGYTDAADRSTVHPGGGYLPSPVPVVVQIDGKIHEGVISGVAVKQPPGSLLNARLRKFWYKEFEE